ARARNVGLSLALITRLLLLASISWIASLVTPLFTIPSIAGLPEFAVSGRDIILLIGGLFLIWKATHEIHNRLEGEEGHDDVKVRPSFTGVIIQIILLDIVFSLDSVITAVGIVDEIGVMVTAVVIAVGIMLIAAGPLSNFVNKHPTVKMLALAFLLLIGVSLLAEGLHQHIEKGYIYAAMGFSVLVEFLNLRSSRKKGTKPVVLHNPYSAQANAAADVGGTATGTTPRP
ncbi:MAG: TerC family protein, partial [Roseiflexaceae bacterium]|nr:TerC family protein [Roseiflexaceae bacterium]